MKSKRLSRILVFLAFAFNTGLGIKAQDVPTLLVKSKALMNAGKYDESFKILESIKDKQLDGYGDTCAAYYNYYMGTCLYFLKRYKEAIPFVHKGISIMEKINLKNCDYIELLYGMGVCNKEIGDFIKAEEYLRRSILKGSLMEDNCAVRDDTYDELADLYVRLGRTDFAENCVKRKGQDNVLRSPETFEAEITALYDLAEFHANQGNVDRYVQVMKNLLNRIEKKIGKNNEEYLKYAALLGLNLRYKYNIPKQAAEIHKDIINIGKTIKSYREEVCFAYEDYLLYLSENSKLDSINIILEKAVKYYNSTKSTNREKRNLYEAIGMRLYEAGNIEEAIKYFEKDWNGEQEKSITTLIHLGNYYCNNDLERALSYYKKAEGQINKNEDLTDTQKRVTFENLMLTYESLGNYQEAFKYAELVEPFAEKMEDIDYYLRYLQVYAVYSIQTNNFVKANEIAMKAAPLFDKISNVDILLLSYVNFGFVYLKLEKLDKAIDINEKGIQLAIKEKGNKCPVLSTLYHNYGRAYMLKGNYARALAALYKSEDLQKKLEGKVMQRTRDYINECLGK